MISARRSEIPLPCTSCERAGFVRVFVNAPSVHMEIAACSTCANDFARVLAAAAHTPRRLQREQALRASRGLSDVSSTPIDPPSAEVSHG